MSSPVPLLTLSHHRECPFSIPGILQALACHNTVVNSLLPQLNNTSTYEQLTMCTSTFYLLAHLIFKTILSIIYYSCPYFRIGKNEAQSFIQDHMATSRVGIRTQAIWLHTLHPYNSTWGMSYSDFYTCYLPYRIASSSRKGCGYGSGIPLDLLSNGAPPGRLSQ